MTDKVLRGIRRRRDGDYEDRATTFVMDKLLAKYGLPLTAEFGRDRATSRLHMQLHELLERHTDAAEAGHDAQADFIDRQIGALLERGLNTR